MEDKQNNRAYKIIGLVGTLMVIFFCLCVGLLLYEFRNLRELVIKKPVATVSPIITEAGYTPIKGIDYQDGTDGSDGLSIKGDDGYTPVKGKDYFDGTNGTNGVDGDSCTTTQTDEGSTITCEDGSESKVYNGTSARPARTTEFCYFEDGTLGQRYVGTSECRMIEVAQ